MKDTDPTPVPPPVAKAPPAEESKKSIHERVGAHLDAKRKVRADAAEQASKKFGVAVSDYAVVDEDLTVSEHAARLKLEGYISVHPLTAETSPKPHWSIQALLACFHAQGIHLQQKMSAELFDQALEHVLHARI